MLLTIISDGKSTFNIFCSWSLTTLSCLRGNQRKSLLEKVNSLHHHDEYLHLDDEASKYLLWVISCTTKWKCYGSGLDNQSSVSLFLFKFFHFFSYIIIFLFFFMCHFSYKWKCFSLDNQCNAVCLYFHLLNKMVTYSFSYKWKCYGLDNQCCVPPPPSRWSNLTLFWIHIYFLSLFPTCQFLSSFPLFFGFAKI